MSFALAPQSRTWSNFFTSQISETMHLERHQTSNGQRLVHNPKKGLWRLSRCGPGGPWSLLRRASRTETAGRAWAWLACESFGLRAANRPFFSSILPGGRRKQTVGKGFASHGGANGEKGKEAGARGDPWSCFPFSYRWINTRHKGTSHEMERKRNRNKKELL